jgi:hypothetical protein
VGIKSRVPQLRNCGRFFSPDPYTETARKYADRFFTFAGYHDHPSSGRQVFVSAICRGLDTASSRTKLKGRVNSNLFSRQRLAAAVPGEFVA